MVNRLIYGQIVSRKGNSWFLLMDKYCSSEYRSYMTKADCNNFNGFRVFFVATKKNV